MDSSPSWVWFLDQDVVDTLLRAEAPPDGFASRAAAHPAVVEAVRRQIAGDTSGATETLAPALAMDNADALWLAGQFACEQGLFREAAHYYARLAQRQPGHPTASFNEGIARGKAREFAAAIEPLQRAVVLDPSRPQAWFALGVCLLQVHRAAEARSAFRQSLELRPGYAPALFGEAAALQMEGKPGEAIAIYDRLLEEHTGSAEAERAAVLENALAAATAGGHDAAAQRYAKSLYQTNPRSTAALVALAVAALDRQDHGAATQWLALLAECRPDDCDGWYNLGVVYSHAGDWPRAANAFETALQLRPSEVGALDGASRAWMELGDREKALALARRWTETAPQSAAAWFRFGWLLFPGDDGAGSGGRVEARAAFAKAAELDPQWAEAWSNLATCLVAEGDPDRARSAYAKALECDAGHVAARHGLALLALDAGDRDAAEQLYAHSGAGHPQIEFRLGLLALRENDAVKAGSHFEQVIAMEESWAAARWNLGQARFAAGEWEAGKQECQRALEMDPGLAAALVQ